MLELLVAMLEARMLVAAMVVKLKTMPLRDRTASCSPCMLCFSPNGPPAAVVYAPAHPDGLRV